MKNNGQPQTEEPQDNGKADTPRTQCKLKDYSITSMSLKMLLRFRRAENNV